MAPSVAGSVVGTVVVGDFAVGDQVISLVNFNGASGSVKKGDHGEVVGECKGATGRKAEGRLNCKFPTHPNINLKITQIKKVEVKAHRSPSEGSGGGET